MAKKIPHKLFLSIVSAFLLSFAAAGYSASDDIAVTADNVDASDILYDDSGLGSDLEASPTETNIDSNSTSDSLDDLLIAESAPQSQQTMSVSTSTFGINGPLKVGVQYSSGFGAIAKVQWVQALSFTNAIALAFDLGPKEYRISATWGHAFNDKNRIKASAEYLAQKMDFDFYTGSDTETIGQGAVGLTYQYLFPQKFVHALNLNAIYSKAQSKDLDPVFFMDNSGFLFENYRRIAGGQDIGVSAGLDFLPTKKTLVGFDINYDAVTYDEKYNDAPDNAQPTGSHDSSGLGATVNLEQILSDFFKLKLSLSDRKIYNNYKADISWLTHTTPNSRLEMNFAVQQISDGSNTDNSGEKNDTRFGVDVSYRWGSEAFDQNEIYTLQSADISTDLTSWTATPAVHMEKVLAIVDQKVVQLMPPNLDGLNNKTIPRDLFPQFAGGTFVFGQDIGVLDLTPFINLGQAAIKSVSAPDLAQYGLQLNIVNGGHGLTLTGVPSLPANGNPITLTVTNISGLSSSATIFLNIASVAPQVIIDEIQPLTVGESPADVGTQKIADLIFGGDPITSNNQAAVNTILANHNLTASFTNPTAANPGQVTISATGNLINFTTGENVPITIATATTSVTGIFLLKISPAPPPIPVINPAIVDAKAGTILSNATVGVVDNLGTNPSLIVNTANFASCFDMSTPPALHLESNQIKLDGTLLPSLPLGLCTVSNAVQVTNLEGGTSVPAPIEINITTVPVPTVSPLGQNPVVYDYDNQATVQTHVATVDWNGLSHGKVLLDDSQKTTCFANTAQNPVIFNYDCSGDICTVKLTSGIIAHQNTGTQCTFPIIASSSPTVNSQPTTITLNFNSIPPTVTAIDGIRVPLNGKFSNLQIATVVWQRGGQGPNSSDPITVDDSQFHCFAQNEPLGATFDQPNTTVLLSGVGGSTIFATGCPFSITVKNNGTVANSSKIFLKTKYFTP